MSRISHAHLSHGQEALLLSIPILGRAHDALSIQSNRTVRQLLPEDAPAIASVSHPPAAGPFRDLYIRCAAKGSPGDSPSWDDVDFSEIPDPQLPNEGTAPEDTLNAIVSHLETEDEGFLYAVWRGYGFWNNVAQQDNPFTTFGPYYIFYSSCISFGPWPGVLDGTLSTETANVIVPLSGSWVIVTPVDCFETFVAAEPERVAGILSDERLVAKEVTLEFRA